MQRRSDPELTKKFYYTLFECFYRSIDDSGFPPSRE